MHTQQPFSGWYIATPASLDAGWHLFASARRSLYFASKRLIDIVLALAALIALAPLLALIGLAVRLDSPGPAIFRQKRVTAYRRVTPEGEVWEIGTFTCYKFRSMYCATTPDLHHAFVKAFITCDHKTMTELNGGETDTAKLVNDPRVSRVGRFIRSASLDELPQLWNVLAGDMSLVGPRPAIPYEVEAYSPWHHRRLTAKPGLTGWWQVKGRCAVTFEDSISLDVWYVDHQSFWLDLKILLLTPQAVLSRRGAV